MRLVFGGRFVSETQDFTRGVVSSYDALRGSPFCPNLDRTARSVGSLNSALARHGSSAVRIRSCDLLVPFGLREAAPMIAYWDSVLEHDPFYGAVKFSARMNRWAAGFSGLSALCMGIELFAK